MAEYRIQGSTLDAIADAINAKTGGSSAMTPAEMVTAIGTISGGGGGGSLPSSISAIDGGEFTFASTTKSTYQITHSLGAVPKGFVIWTDDVDISTDANNTVIRGVFIVDESANGSVTSYLYQMSAYNNNFNNYTRSIGSNYSGYANANYISYNVGNVSYAAQYTYKWFAWA